MEENKFVGTILVDFGNIPISNTQCYRVLKAEDPITKEVFLSVQKWWRKDTNSQWIASKGFRLSPDMAVQLGTLMVDSGKETSLEK